MLGPMMLPHVSLPIAKATKPAAVADLEIIPVRGT
jgi:hypothetical protein